MRFFFLAAQSSVGLSFEQPAETPESIILGALNMLEALRFLGKPIKLYHASSSECFGDLGQQAATEDAPFRPRSPYAIAKASAHWLVANYREAYSGEWQKVFTFEQNQCSRSFRITVHVRPERVFTLP